MALAVGSYLGLTGVLIVADDRKKQKQRETEALKCAGEALALACKETELGLPVATAPPVTAAGAAPYWTGPHLCGCLLCRNDTRYWYADVRYCPVHWKASVTPVKGQDVPPLEQLARVAAQHQLPVIFPDGDMRTATEVGGPHLAEPEPEPPYVPDGQAELTADLLAVIKAQVDDAVEADGGRYAGRRHWEMNAEWAGEVKRLKGRDGKQLWQPRARTMPPGYPREYLFKYPVRVNDDFGAPSLEVT
jgi:hypothetical protein